MDSLILKFIKVIKKYFLLFFSICLFTITYAQNAIEKGLNAINEDMVEGQLRFLSSDWTEGRATGTRGAYLAADYIASMFKVYGLEPGGDMVNQRFSRAERSKGKKDRKYRGYFQNFPLIEYSPSEEQELRLITKSKASVSNMDFNYKTDFDVSSGHLSQSGSGEIIFVGYGLKDEERAYDDFEKIDLEGKIILRLSGYPGHKDPESPSHERFAPKNRWEAYQMRRKKNEALARKGVLAVLEVDNEGYGYKAWSDNIPFRYNSSMYEGGKKPESYYDTRMTFPGDSLNLRPPVFTISLRLANEILSGTGIDIVRFEESSAEKAKPQSGELKGKEISFTTNVDSRLINARNVVGVLKGKDTSNIIVIGGHYDHLGKHEGYIWNGADDNASGTVGVMSIARACMQTGEVPEKSIVFAAWSGEEKGLWGSRYFAEHPYEDKNVILNLNYDMISRDNEDDEKGNKCRMSYTEAYPALEEISKENIETYGIDLDVTFRPSSSARGGSDHAPFAQKGIPYFYFMAGFPPEYHQPDDHIELVNIPKMTNIIRLGYLNIWRFANSDEWMKNQ